MTPLLPRSRSGKVWLLTALICVVLAVLVWFLGDWLALRGASLWWLRAGLWVLELVAAGLIVWFLAGPAAGRESGASPGGEELDTILATAAARLGGARAAGAPGLRSIPLIVVLGPPGSAKTTVVVNSGIAPDLLAGEVFHGDRIGPTPAINLWYTQRTVLVEVGAKVAADAGRWSRLLRRLRPRTLRATLTGRPQAPRAAVVCFSCEELLKAGAVQAVSGAARELRGQLTQLAQKFGVQLPVYVVFTKADRIPYFAEFVEHLSREEAEQVLGTTLPWPGRTAAGVYADREFQRLSAASDRLLGALATKRLSVLARETDGERKAGAYEFPRELRKTVPAALQFLLDLCRPSQLDVSPVLRGFYYTGVRAVAVTDAAPAPAAQGPAAGAGRVAAATQVFDSMGRGAAPRAPGGAAAPGARRLPQWLFLSTLFRDVLLRDGAPAAVAQGARAVAALRRSGLAAVVLFSLLGGLWSAVQYSRNDGAVSAAVDLGKVGVSSKDLPPVETLALLETVRAHLGRLSSWRRWWWYKGTGLYPELLRLYKARFDQILLEPARLSLLTWLGGLPSEPKATDQYREAYEQLKTYLMSTSAPEKLAADFVVPRLMERWANGRQVDSVPRELARRQFQFYATTLCRTAACATAAEGAAVARTRAFLGKFKGVDRFYNLIVSDASAKNQGVLFSRRFPKAEGVVVAPHEVPGAFTERGWAAVNDALKHVDQQADDWVLGEQEGGPLDRAKLVADLRAMYVAEYLRQWRAFLDAASVPPYGGAKDASKKLAQLGGNQSPLWQLLSLVAQNVKVDPNVIGAAFQPVSVVVPAGAAVSDLTKPYVAALTSLQVAVDQMASAGPSGVQGLAQTTMQAAAGARPTVVQIAQKFSTSDDAAAQVGARVSSLLEGPIVRVEQLVSYLPVATLNGRGAAFCNAFLPVLVKYPFKPDAHADATLAEVASLLDPASGAVTRFYNEALQDVLVKQGAQFVPKPGAASRPAPAFVHFFNRLAAAGDALWPAGSKDPTFDFTLKLLASETIPSATFSMDGQVHTFTRTSMAAEPFRWAGPTASAIRVFGASRGRDETLLGEDGTWALFKLLRRGAWQTSGATSVVRWPVTIGGQPAQLWAELNLGGAGPLLRGDYFAGMSCVSQILQ